MQTVQVTKGFNVTTGRENNNSSGGMQNAPLLESDFTVISEWVCVHLISANFTNPPHSAVLTLIVCTSI